MNQVDANCYRVESTNAAAGGMAQGRGKPTRKGTPQSPSWSQDSACGGSFWAKGASPPLAVSSFSSLLIYFLYLSEKGKHGFCVFSFAYYILFVFWFSSASVQQLPTQGVHCPSQHHLFPDSAWPLGSSPPGRLCLHPALC